MRFRVFAFSMVLSAQAALGYKSPGIAKDDNFQRASGTGFLRCQEAQEYPHLSLGKYSFAIIAKEGTKHAGKKVGVIWATYSELGLSPSSAKEAVEIANLEVDLDYRRCGYAEAALRTLIGIFRAPSRKELNFNRFELSVGLDAHRTAARALYQKVGFTMYRQVTDIGYGFMSLPRYPDTASSNP